MKNIIVLSFCLLMALCGCKAVNTAGDAVLDVGKGYAADKLDEKAALWAGEVVSQFPDITADTSLADGVKIISKGLLTKGAHDLALRTASAKNKEEVSLIVSQYSKEWITYWAKTNLLWLLAALFTFLAAWLRKKKEEWRKKFGLVVTKIQDARVDKGAPAPVTADELVTLIKTAVQSTNAFGISEEDMTKAVKLFTEPSKAGLIEVGISLLGKLFSKKDTTTPTIA